MTIVVLAAVVAILAAGGHYIWKRVGPNVLKLTRCGIERGDRFGSTTCFRNATQRTDPAVIKAYLGEEDEVELPPEVAEALRVERDRASDSD